MRYEHKGNFKHIPTDRWTFQTEMCYRFKTKCELCPENIVCEKYAPSFNEYGIKPIKYAMIKTLEKLGKPKGASDAYYEIFGEEDDTRDE